jgi:serine/threonine-protein kinase
MQAEENHSDLLFEKYKVIECLKKDEYSCVYIADHTYLGKKILLKTLNTDSIENTLWLDRFKREAKILARLDHVNIIKVLDFGKHKNIFYLSFEYFDSRNLRDILKENDLTFDQKRQILIQLAQGLSIAHQAGIVHRDIKPENILIDDQNNLKIADFGLAVILNESMLTSKSSLVGTPSYMSPEQIRGESITLKSDLFSLGIVAYELFCGDNPFLGIDINTTINNILGFDENAIFTRVAHLPVEISDLIKRMLRKDHSKRLDSAQEILKSLKSGTIPERPKKIRKRINSKSLIIVSILIVLVVILIIIRPIFRDENGRSMEQDLSALESKEMTAITDKNAENNVKVSNDLNSEPEVEDVSFLETAKKKPQLPGKLIVQSIPQSEVYIDSQYVGTIPLQEYIELPEGEYNLGLIHPGYPKYQRPIIIKSGETTWMRLSPDTLFGYLQCNIYPWGEVHIDGKNIGQSPFQKPYILAPGNYGLTIWNPKFSVITDSVNIIQAETTEYKVNLEQVGQRVGLY